MKFLDFLKLFDYGLEFSATIFFAILVKILISISKITTIFSLFDVLNLLFKNQIIYLVPMYYLYTIYLDFGYYFKAIRDFYSLKIFLDTNNGIFEEKLIKDNSKKWDIDEDEYKKNILPYVYSLLSMQKYYEKKDIFMHSQLIKTLSKLN